MKYAAILFTIAVLGLLAGALVLVARHGDDNEVSPIASSSPSATATRSATGSPKPSATSSPAASVCKPNPDPATAADNVVDAPLSRAAVTSPVTVSGRIAAFEATFRITIFDASGDITADQSAHSAEGQVLSPFSERVAFSVSKETPACIWVYENSARDGNPVNVVQVPVTLKP